MKPQVNEIIDVIREKIADKPGSAPTPQALKRWLSQQGYSRNDIDAAMGMLKAAHETQQQPYVAVEPVRACRSFTAQETSKLTTEAREALQRLELYALVSLPELEAILDRLGQFDGEVGLEELDYLVSWIVCGNRDAQSQDIIYNVLEKTPNTLH